MDCANRSLSFASGALGEPAFPDRAIAAARSAELMQRFYRHLRSGKSKDEALREAQLELIRSPLRVPDGRGGWTERNAAAPYFWAALQLVGDRR